MAENPYIILDFETGGFNASKNAVTQIGMLCIDGETLQEVGRYESYIKPYNYQYDKAALDFTGLSLDFLENKGKELKEVAREVFELIKEWHQKTSKTYTKKPILVGHNLKFDVPFMQQIAKETKNDLSKLLEGQLDFYGNFYPGYIDTMYLAKLSHGNDISFPSYTLGNCCSKMGVELVNAHNAINDVIGTKELLISYVNRLRNINTGEGVQEKIRVRDKFHFKISNK